MPLDRYFFAGRSIDALTFAMIGLRYGINSALQRIFELCRETNTSQYTYRLNTLLSTLQSKSSCQ